MEPKICDDSTNSRISIALAVFVGPARLSRHQVVVLTEKTFRRRLCTYWLC